MQNNKIYYAGIGSRKTPPDILEEMKVVGYVLAKEGFILRSGGADGADSAFEKGCDQAKGEKEIFLPWKDFNGNSSIHYTPSPEAFELAEKHHPHWNSLKHGAKCLHARNGHQILGADLKTPVSVVVCYSCGVGGTEQALRIARSLNIFEYNFCDILPHTGARPSILEILHAIFEKTNNIPTTLAVGKSGTNKNILSYRNLL
jgi:hypothetical protein